MKKFKTWRNPYDTGVTPCRFKEIEIKEGVTVLVGCNGAGKTTLIHNICECLRKENVQFIHYNNLKDTNTSVNSLIFSNDTISLGATLLTSSEGECINLRLGYMSDRIINYIKTGEDSKNDNRFARAFRKAVGFEEENEENTTNERWILFDATDSGLSIDNVVELKGVFSILLEKAEECGVTLYIVISANEYELASGNDCFDVNACKYIRFENYEDYRDFILDNAKKKERREEKAREWRRKREEREEKERKKWDVKNKD